MMQLTIDGRAVEAAAGETLLTLVQRLGLDTEDLALRPLAAKIAGEIFTLNYVPVRLESGRKKNTAETMQPTLRKAMRASGGVVTLLRYDCEAGRRVYERTMLFTFLLALKKLFPDAIARVEYAIGTGIYVNIVKEPALTKNDVMRLRRAYDRIVKANYRLERKRLDIDEAIAFFANDGQVDKVRLLEYRDFTYFDVYRHGAYMDYFYGEMAPSTGYASVCGLIYQAPGLFLMRPDPADLNRASTPKPMPRLAAVLHESDEWSRLMHCNNVADLNDMVKDGRIRTLIRVNEALHEKRYAYIADEIVKRGAKAVMIAGPSSSGKTTSANRLCVQLRVHGKSPVLMSLDDYYIDRDKILPDETGVVDLEHINTIDTALFRENLTDLLAGKTVEPPRFDFLLGKRVPSGQTLRIDENTPLVIEGLHALNPALLPETIRHDDIYKLYVSALTTLNLDDHNRIPTTHLRLLRRLVRDYETRGASVDRTMSMWPSVRAGEERWIFPYQEQADAIFNTTLVYEAAVMKKHIFPLLTAVQPDSPYYADVRALVKMLNYFLDANVEDEIPPTSILREFIGGNTFYR